MDLGKLHGRRLVFESSAQKINKLRHSSFVWMLCLREQPCICSDEGATVVGQAEHEEQSAKHGGNKDMLVLAKKVSRVLLLMGLESRGAYGMMLEDSMSPEQCEMEQENQKHEDNYSLWLGLFGILFLMVTVWTVFPWRGYKWIKGLWQDHDNLCLQVAELDAYAGRIRTDADSLQGAATELRSEWDQMEVSQNMLSDSVDSIHYGLVELGGFTRHSELSAAERRHMYAQEQGNLVAARTMGSQRYLYLQVVRQSNRGVAGGEDTDERMEDMESEQDEEAEDLPVGPDAADGHFDHLIRGIRDEINVALQRHHYRDAADLQGVVLYDNLNAGNLSASSPQRGNIVQEICFRLESMAPRYEILVPQVAVRLRMNAFTK